MGSTNPKPAKSLPRAVQISRILLRPQNRGPVLAAVAAIAAVAGLMVAWNRWGEPATRTEEYLVTPDKIVVTPRPAWIHADVKAEVVRAASLRQLDLRNRDLVERIAQAFQLHAWVDRVVRVQKKFPARIEVELEYRRPVAAVEITTRGQPGLLFIDAQSVLLPSGDFAQNQASQFPRIAVSEALPSGIYGSPWGDPRVAGAARIAAVWGERFHAAGLYRIVTAESLSGELLYELRTPQQTRVVWGHAPGREAAGEPGAEQKIETLLQLVADKGPLDREDGPRLIDLRQPGAGR